MKKFFHLILPFFLTFFLNSQQVSEELLSQVIDNQELSIDLIDQAVGEDVITNEDSSLVEVDILEDEIFGHNFIRTIPTSISSTSDLPVPNDYVVGLGDSLKIVLTGGKNEIFTLKVSLDGNVFFPELGSFNFTGLTINEVRKQVDEIVKLSYVGTDVSVSLEGLAARKINIIGAVKQPGSYIVNPFSTITSVLAYSGGFEDFASVRDIVLIRSGKKMKFDLYDLLIFGNRISDINIQQGDTVLVNSTDKLLEIKGEVNRPMIYEYKEGETINDLINFSMGLKLTANSQKIAVVDFSDEYLTTKITEVNLNDQVSINDFNSPDSIEVFTRNSSPKLLVKILGPIENEGFFEMPESKNLSDLLKNVNFSSKVNPYIAVVQEGNFSKLFSLADKNTQDLILKENYELIFFERNDPVLEELINDFSIDEQREFLDISSYGLSNNSINLIYDYMLRIKFSGNEIYFPFFGEITAKEVVDSIGLDLTGFHTDQTFYIAPLKDLTVKADLDVLKISAEKFNSLVLREVIDQTVTISIEGQVNFPGSYKMPSNTTLEEIYLIAGGYRADADPKAVIFTRESIRQKNLEDIAKAKNTIRKTLVLKSSLNPVSPEILLLLDQVIDESNLGRISGNLSYESEGLDDFLLEDGDEIFIPKRTNTVSILGEVLNPASFIYSKDMSLNSLISLSGGYSENALKRSVYVIRSNGEVKKSYGLFYRNVKILPGDTIVVPTKLSANGELLAIIEPVTSVLSNLAFSAAALDNLRQ